MTGAGIPVGATAWFWWSPGAAVNCQSNFSVQKCQAAMWAAQFLAKELILHLRSSGITW